MRFFIVGMGRAGSSLFFSLRKRGHICVGYHSLKPHDDVDAEFYPELQDIPRVDTIFFTVPDSLIPVISEKVPRNRAHVFAHLSGNMPSNIFGREGVLSIHPIVSIGQRNMELLGLPWTIEGDKKGLEMGKRIVEELDGRYYIIHAEDRPLYHAACVIGSNLVLTLLSYAGEILNGLGIEKSEVLTLARSVIDNMDSEGFDKAKTGPVERGDWETLRNDLIALKRKYPYLFQSLANLILLNAHLVSREKGKEYEENVLSIISDVNSLRG